MGLALTLDQSQKMLTRTENSRGALSRGIQTLRLLDVLTSPKEIALLLHRPSFFKGVGEGTYRCIYTYPGRTR